MEFLGALYWHKNLPRDRMRNGCNCFCGECMTNRAVIVILSTTLMVAGVTIGWFGNQLLSEPAVVTTEVKVEELEAEFSEEELARLCAGNVKEHKEGILDLQGKVKGLQTTLQEKEKELRSGCQ